MGHRWIVIAATVLLIGLAACTAALPEGYGALKSVVNGQTGSMGPAATLSPLADNITTTNRLLVLGDDGNIYITRPDGSESRALSSDAGPSHLYRQPTWSPLGDRVAWVEALPAGDVVTSSLHVSRPDGSEAAQVATTATAFYLFWSPDGSRLAYLANGSRGLDLALFEPGKGGNPIQVLDHGSPLYFSWAPDGQRLLTHVGTDHLGLLALDGTQTVLASQPASFAAPRWGPDSASLVYAILADGEQRLVVTDLEGMVQRKLASFEGNLTFGLRPDGKQVAYVDTVLPVPSAAFGPLFVTDLATGAAKLISEGPVLAFFWSPDGRYLLYLVLETTGTPSNAVQTSFRAQQDQPVWMSWHVWGERRSVSFGRFVPSPTMLLEYLRFFDQYAQSTTLWAPDGSAFTYAGASENGEDGIWVQSLVEGAAAVRVAPGVMANWSPR